jgi:hypothetical protein
MQCDVDGRLLQHVGLDRNRARYQQIVGSSGLSGDREDAMAAGDEETKNRRADRALGADQEIFMPNKTGQRSRL